MYEKINVKKWFRAFLSYFYYNFLINCLKIIKKLLGTYLKAILNFANISIFLFVLFFYFFIFSHHYKGGMIETTKCSMK